MKGLLKTAYSSAVMQEAAAEEDKGKKRRRAKPREATSAADGDDEKSPAAPKKKQRKNTKGQKMALEEEEGDGEGEAVAGKRKRSRSRAAAKGNAPDVGLVREVTSVLEQTHGMVVKEENVSNACGHKREVLDAAVALVLSQNTSNKNSSRALASLRAKYPSFAAIRTAPAKEVEETIQAGGLATVKTKRIQALLQGIYDRHGACSLEHLRDMTTEAAKEELATYTGIGPKSIACLLMFTLHRPEFAVDTHVHRLCNRIFDTETKTADHTYRLMNSVVPDDQKHDLHVLLIRHGRRVCRAINPQCHSCPLAETRCAYFRKKQAGNGEGVEAEIEGGEEGAGAADRGEDGEEVRADANE